MNSLLHPEVTSKPLMKVIDTVLKDIDPFMNPPTKFTSVDGLVDDVDAARGSNSFEPQTQVFQWQETINY